MRTGPEPTAAPGQVRETLDTVHLVGLPRALTVKQTARLWNCSPDVIYEAIGRGECPVQVLRIGRVIRLPRSAVLEAIGLTEPAAEAAECRES